jgi:hypothetical protein
LHDSKKDKKSIVEIVLGSTRQNFSACILGYSGPLSTMTELMKILAYFDVFRLILAYKTPKIHD